MTRRSIFFSPSVVAVFVALGTAAFPRSAAADGGLGYPLATPVGIFGGIAYVQYDGTFAGQTSTGPIVSPIGSPLRRM